MPLYEYQCAQCGYRYEKIQKFNSEGDSACPKCGGELHRPLTAPALQFKGAGWYVNDYAPKGSGSSSPDKPAGESAAGGEAKPAAETKPAGESKPAATESTPKSAAPTTSKSE